MSAQTQNWTIPTDATGVFKATEKRLATEERRPRITKASDLMGPGLAPYAVELNDLNSDTASFNGMWVVPPNAIGSPDVAKWFSGHTIANLTGGIQFMSTFLVADAPHVTYMRGFEYAVSGGTRFYSDWQEVGGASGDVFEEQEARIALPLSTGHGAASSNDPYYRKVTPSLVKMGGGVTKTNGTAFGTGGILIGTLPVGYRPSVHEQSFSIRGATSASVVTRARIATDGGVYIHVSSSTGVTIAYLDGVLIDLSPGI